MEVSSIITDAEQQQQQHEQQQEQPHRENPRIQEQSQPLQPNQENSELPEQSQPLQLNQVNSQLPEQSQPLPQHPQQPQTQDYYHQIPGQSYDQSYYSYYQQYPYQNQWSYDPQSLNYAYYQSDYSAAYPQSVYQQHEAVHAVSAPPAGAPIADAGGTGAPELPQPHQFHQQSAFPSVQSSGNALVSPGMNPAAAAAIAALQQLTQFAGTMGAAERAMAGFPVDNLGFGPIAMRAPGGRHPHRGGGRRGGGRGNVSRHHGSAPAFRGRGRGRGRGRSRHFQAKGVTSTSSHPEPSAVTVHSTDAVDNAAQSGPAPEKVAPSRQHVQIAWCELCRVDCNSLEILEQHKNGKRHKKNLLRMEELKNTIKPGEEIPSNQERIIDSKPDESQQPQIAQGVEEQNPAENVPPEITNDLPTMESNLQNSTGKLPEVTAEMSDQQEKNPRMNMFDNRRLGNKRKMKGGRGAKRMKISESKKRPIEPPKPKVVIPLICDLCNVKCDTKEVLDRHLSGKKHMAKLKRFEGHQAMYGPKGLQVLYPPNPIAQTHFLSQGHQPFAGSLSTIPTAHQSVASSDHQAPQNSVLQQSEACLTDEANFAPAVTQSSMPQQTEATVT